MTPIMSSKPFEIEIVIEGRLDPRRASGWFEGLSLSSQPDETTLLTGPVTDQAALFALISRIRDLGLRLISVRRIENLSNI